MRPTAWLTLLLASTGLAYVREQVSGTTTPLMRVDNTAIQFYLNEQIVPGYQSSASGSTVTVITSDSNPQQAVHSALDSWNAVSTANLHFLPLILTPSVINPNDFQATIAFGSTAADLSAVGGALALTIDSYVLGPANQGASGPVGCSANCTYPASGDIFDSDIILNPEYSFSTTGVPGTHDLQAVMLHELGHSLSANHTGLLGASMFQFPTQHFLTADDLAFVNSAYPLPSAGAPLGTIGGTVTVAGAGPVPYALLTAFDTSAGVTVGGITNPDGTYAFDVPPGAYQIYAEPLNGLVPINIYLTSAQANLAAATKFQTTLYNGTLTVSSNSTATANITVTSGASTLAAPVVAVTPVNGNVSTGNTGGPATVASGQAVDLVLSGAGFDATLADSNFAFYGQGISLKPGSVRVDPSQTFNGFPLLRLTLNVAATTTPSLASFIVTSGSNTLSFSGALVIVPPTPTTTTQNIKSSASGLAGSVSPGGLYTIYGPSNLLGPTGGPLYGGFNNNGFDSYALLASYLDGVTVTFDGVPAPLFFVDGQVTGQNFGQLNVQAPFEVAGKTSTQVVVNYLGSASAPVTVPVVPAQPALFLSCGGTVCAINQDGSTNSAANPAPRGSYIEIFGTGLGKVDYTVLTGQGAPAPPAGFTGNYTYSIGGSAPAPALFGGWTPTEVGLAQWNLQIPTGIGTGAVSIVVSDSAGDTSQSGATIFVQ
jgi:uncharacterized protein (TIGR03437 family)